MSFYTFEGARTGDPIFRSVEQANKHSGSEDKVLRSFISYDACYAYQKRKIVVNVKMSNSRWIVECEGKESLSKVSFNSIIEAYIDAIKNVLMRNQNVQFVCEHDEIVRLYKRFRDGVEVGDQYKEVLHDVINSDSDIVKKETINLDISARMQRPISRKVR